MPEPVSRLELRVLPGEVTIWRADRDTAVPALQEDLGPLVSVTRTAGELSGICAAEGVPDVATRTEPGWTVLEVAGPLDLALTGVLASLTAALAAAAVPVFALSTFDTDYLLVRTATLALAIRALRAAGHVVSADPAARE